MMTLPITPDSPVINFGLGLTSVTVQAGTPVTVWQHTLYNTGAFNFVLSAPGTIQQISPYEYAVTCNVPGTYSLSLSVVPSDKRNSLVSNSLTLIVE